MPPIVSIFGKALDTGFNIIENTFFNSWAEEREKQARLENYQYNEQAADNADRRTRKLYEDYMTPQARLKMYQEAGLSPSLMFGDGAAAPQPTPGAQGSGVSGISPNVFGSTTGSLLATNALQLAEARKANAEADTIEGKNKRGQTQIEKLVGEVAYQQLVNEAVEWDNSKKSLELNLLATYGQEEMEAKIKEMVNNANLLQEKAREQKVKGNISEKTENALIEMVNKDLQQKSVDIAYTIAKKKLTESNIKVNEHTIKKIVQEIADNHHAVMLQDEQVFINYQEIRELIRHNMKEEELKDKALMIQVTEDIIDGIKIGTRLLKPFKPNSKKKK